jgi:hypothetical protein
MRSDWYEAFMSESFSGILIGVPVLPCSKDKFCDFWAETNRFSEKGENSPVNLPVVVFLSGIADQIRLGKE